MSMSLFILFAATVQNQEPRGTLRPIPASSAQRLLHRLPLCPITSKFGSRHYHTLLYAIGEWQFHQAIF